MRCAIRAIIIKNCSREAAAEQLVKHSRAVLPPLRIAAMRLGLSRLFVRSTATPLRGKARASLQIEELEDRVVLYTSPFELGTLPGLGGAAGFVLNGPSASAAAGIAVSRAGDVNGDGLDDLLIGARDGNPSLTLSGTVYVVFGRADGFGGSLDLS